MGFTDYTTSPRTPKAFNELKAEGFEVEQKNGQYFVKIDDISVQVFEYDTVWTVKARRDEQVQNKQDEKQEKESGLQKLLKDLKVKFSICCDAFDTSLENMIDARHNYVTFMMRNHANTLSDLKGTNAYKEGEVLQNEKYATSYTEIKALAEVLSTNNEIQSVCSELRYLA